MTIVTSARVRNAGMLDRSGTLSAREADRRLVAGATSETSDSTHFDTVRFPPPTWARDLFTTAFDDGTAAYSPYRGHPAVLATVAENISTWIGQDVDPGSEVLLTPGTQGGLFSVFSALVDPGDEVLLLDPEYLFTERMLTFLGARVSRIPLVVDGEFGPTPDLDALEAALARNPKLFAFSNPNNPTGVVFDKRVLQQIADLVLRSETLVVVDALYARLTYPGVEYAHLRTLPGMRERTITMLGPSKTESLSGFRLGIVLAPPTVTDAAEDVLALTALRAPAYSQFVLARWLVEDAGWLESRVKDLHDLQKMTLAAFSRLEWVNLVPGGGTAYVFPDVSALGLPDAEVAETLRDEAGILISPGYQFGEHGRGHFRLCYARDEVEWAHKLELIVASLERMYARVQSASKTGVGS